MLKKISACIITAAVITASLLFFASCEKHGIYKLAEMILTGNRQDGSVEKFEAEFNIKIKKEKPDDPIPDNINIKSDGEFYHLAGSRILHASINLHIEDYYLKIYVQNGAVYFETGETAKLIFDILTAAGLLDFTESKVLKEIIFTGSGEEKPKILQIDLNGFELPGFGRDIKNTVKIENPKLSAIADPKPGRAQYKEFAPDMILNFSEALAQAKKELLKLPGYRYSEIFIVIEPGENKNNYLQILATLENGGREVLEKVKIDADVSKIKTNDSLLSENILPMRYILELLGESVGWDAESKRAYMIKDGKSVYFDGRLINSRTYINVFQIMLKTDYMITHTQAGEYLEIKITRGK